MMSRKLVGKMVRVATWLYALRITLTITAIILTARTITHTVDNTPCMRA